MTRWLIVGLSGVTCSGKTTLARKLHESIRHSVYMNQDHYFLPIDDPRHKYIDELKHHNWDIMASLDIQKMHMDVFKLIESPSNANSADRKDTDDSEMRVLIIDGFLIFDYKPIEELCHLRYFFTLTKQQCWQRRQRRSYHPPDVPNYFDRIVWPEYERYRDKIVRDYDLYQKITFIDGGHDVKENFQKIFNDVIKLL